MASAAYNDLLNKYNTLVAHAQSLQESLKSKEEQWEKESQKYKSIEDNTRQLCKLILAKDKSQINLGTENGAWGSLSTRDIIVQATQSYKKYNKERALALQQILDLAEERQNKIDGLLDQIAFMENTGEIPKKDFPTEEAPVESKQESKPVETSGDGLNIKIVANENEGIEDLFSDIVEPTENSIPIQYSKGKITQAREKKRQKKVFDKYVKELDLGKLLNDMSELQKTIIKIIGSKGYSAVSDIIREIKTTDMWSNKNSKSIENRTYSVFKELQANGIVTSEKVSIPLTGKSNFSIVQFTEVGLRIYELMTGGKAIQSEAQTLIIDHDNIFHGYGIKAIYEGLIESGLYRDVNMFCRKHPFIVDPKKNKNITYIPDIIATYGADKRRCFFEYERGFTDKEDIIEKCNKMVRFTRDLYFITNGSEDAKRLSEQLKYWKVGALKRGLKVKVFLSTARFFQNQNFDIKKKWQYVYPESSSEPIACPD